LRVLQESEFQKIGSSEVKRVDVRVIATSNRNINEAIDEGIFREDLFHRLSVFPLSVPALRDRITDVPMLTRHFVEKYIRLYELPEKEINEALSEKLISFSWPGNVRQLENVIQRGVILSADRTMIGEEDVFNDFFKDAEPRNEGNGLPGKRVPQTIDDMERVMIMKALSKTNNNQQRAAEKLGISARTIRNKLRRYRECGLMA
jgi:transcriptional regulator with PAS, ATPase and Fis domain